MATYVVGDLQGCHDALQRLKAAIDFGASDHMIFAGDLVNRGPANLEVLRSVRGAEAVLGNHDLHLLARAFGVASAKPSDTVEDVLSAPDRDASIGWLLDRPLLLEVGDDVIVHAGLHPAWDRGEARARAKAVSERLRRDPAPLLERSGSSSTGELSELRASLAILTRIRAVDGAGEPDPGFSGSLADLPAGREPWFRFHRASTDWGPGRILFGHWSALGYHREGRYACLDSGCVWGRALTALRLDDEAVFQIAATPPR
jgi:bis(5'-nucleosyl)-tetraphosphatase (symmetrical)